MGSNFSRIKINGTEKQKTENGTEKIMETVPQLVLQIYIFAVHKSPYGNDHLIVLTQTAACIASLESLSGSFVSYHRSLRLFLPNKISLT